MQRVTLERGFCDLVFHVLAHVPLASVPWGLYDAAYVQWARAHAGDSEARPLGRDAAVLATQLTAAPMGIAVQALAVLFADLADALRLQDLELTTLQPAQVAEPAWLRAVCAANPAAELLRCSALLEAPTHAALQTHAPAFVATALRAALASYVRCAPALAACEVRCCRALTRHGRLFGDRIYVGVPDAALGVSVEHVAMQAAHEATVREVALAATHSNSELLERRVEAVALVVLGTRAAAVGLRDEHAAWGENFAVSPEDCAFERLATAERALAHSLLQ